MCTEYYMSPTACEIMNIPQNRHSMITDDYRWLQSIITISSSLEKVWLQLWLWLRKKLNRLQSITITIVISPNPVIHICDTFRKHFFYIKEVYM